MRILLSFVAIFNWNLQQFDVENVFSHGDLDEEINMEMAPGFERKKRMLCRLKKALHELKQSPHAWFGRSIKVMIKLAYRQSQADHALFIRHSKTGKPTALLVYVDGITVAGDDSEEIQKIEV